MKKMFTIISSCMMKIIIIQCFSCVCSVVMEGWGGDSYCHQPNFVAIGLVSKGPFSWFCAHFPHIFTRQNCRQILLGKNVRKMRQLHIQKINKVYICFGLFCFILNIYSIAYTCIDLYMYQ